MLKGMKNLLFLLPLTLLAACAPTTSQSNGPLRGGEVLWVTGTSGTGQNVNEKYVLKDKPTRSDGYWYYDVKEDGALLRMIDVAIKTNQEFMYIEDRNLDRVSKERPGVTVCYAYPGSQGWQEAKGYLFQGTLEEYRKLNDSFKNKTDDAAWNDFLGKAGRCTITRQ